MMVVPIMLVVNITFLLYWWVKQSWTWTQNSGSKRWTHVNRPAFSHKPITSPLM